MVIGVINSILLLISIYLICRYIFKIYIVIKRNREKDNKKMKYIIYNSVMIIVLLTAWILGIFVIRITHITGDSMEPTIIDGQWVIENIMDKHIERGDIITFYINGGEKKLIKRVIATEGESIEVKNNNIYIDGKRLVENYCTESFEKDFELIVVPKGEYFMMGDNRPISLDSRYKKVGTIKKSQICGSVLFVD